MKTLAYLAGAVPMQGILYLPANVSGKVPGVVIAPEWWGMTEHVKNAGERLAQAGYAALVMDLYGEGNTTDVAAQANAWMSALLDNPAELLARAKAGWKRWPNRKTWTKTAWPPSASASAAKWRWKWRVPDCRSKPRSASTAASSLLPQRKKARCRRRYWLSTAKRTAW